MDYTAIDHVETDSMKNEARDRWGDTEAYKSYKEKAQKGHDFDKAGEQMMEIFASIGTLTSLSPEDATVQSEIKRLQSFISENFYPCTNEILHGLGKMYVCDMRFKANIDQKGGEGTAEFASKAIEAYVKH
ncbi:MAG: TipAS antibiotic-recognition domain-containing protein [Clostridia bacterium]|nr:TipAS antibiotic-recognition domain-containing protein [Clostridia bacterium]